MKKKEIIAYLSLSILIFFYLNCFNSNNNYSNINTHKSFNPDSLLKRKNSVELIIESEFDNYLLGQNVWVKVDLINNTDSNYYVMESIAPGILKFSIIDPDGNRVSSGGFTVDTIFGDTILTLKPGERYQEIMSLEHHLNSREYKIGTYTLSGSFSGHENTPYLESNTIEIEVLPPIGDDKELYELVNPSSKVRDKNSKLSDLLSLHPESVYAPQLYTLLITYSNYSKGSSEIFESSCDNYFKKYMDFFETKHILTQYGLYLRETKKISNKEMDKIFNKLENQNKTEKTKIIFNSFSQLTYKHLKERR